MFGLNTSLCDVRKVLLKTHVNLITTHSLTHLAFLFNHELGGFHKVCYYQLAHEDHVLDFQNDFPLRVHMS